MPDIDVGQISEALNNKSDLNLLNVNAEGLSYGSGWGKPSDNYIDLSIQVSAGSYIAPANGFVTVACADGGAVYLSARTSSNPSDDNIVVGNASLNVANSGALACIPVYKNQLFTVHYTTTLVYVRFTYAQGEEVGE